MNRSDPLSPSTPEAQGIPSAAILDFVRAAEARVGGLDSFMLLRHAHLVASGWWAPYAPAYPHELFSLTKSFTATAVGLAVAEGHLTVDDPVIALLPDDAPAEVSPHLAALRVRHLLTMTVGHAQEPTLRDAAQAGGNWIKAILAHPVVHAPGTRFLYNSSASHLLSAIVQRCVGAPLVDYLEPRLFAPLGIERPHWQTSPRGINTGGWGLSLKTEDIARFGQLYLQEGVWQGQQIVPATWVAEATARQMDNAPNDNPEWRQGYGYQFWRCRHGCYRGDGGFGQYCLVMPDRDAVLAITSGVSDMQAVLDLVWAHLLPAMGPAPLEPDRAAQRALEEALAGLSYPVAAGAAEAPVAAHVSGRTYHMDENPQQVASISFDYRSDGCTITVRDDRGTHPLEAGHGAWRTCTTTWAPGPPRRIAGSGAWTAADTYEAALCMVETPFRPTLTCRFAGDQVTVDARVNVSFGELTQPTLVGRAATS